MIKAETISLRPLELCHLDKTREWANDPELMRLLNRSSPVSSSEHEQWFKSLSQRKDCIYFAIETKDHSIHVGNIWLWNIDLRHRHAELRIVIGNESDTGKGVGTEAITQLCEYSFEQLNLHKVYAYVLAINPRARRAFEKSGFVLEGTLRDDRWIGDSYTDAYLLGKLR